MTKDQFCNLSPVLLENFSAAENTSLREKGDGPVAVDEHYKCQAADGNLGEWLFLLMMTCIILLLEGNNVYRVSSAYIYAYHKLTVH